MSFCLVLLAAGDSKRFGSKTPKPFIKIGKKTLLEYSLIKFGKINVQTIIVSFRGLQMMKNSLRNYPVQNVK